MDLIDEPIKDMMFDVKEFESTDYIVKNDRISFTPTLGYKTLFTYYHYIIKLQYIYNVDHVVMLKFQKNFMLF